MGKIFKWIGIIIVIFIGIGIVGAIANGGKSSEKVGSTSSNSSSSTSTDILADSYKIGDIVKIRDYIFTLNTFTDNVSSGNQFIAPKTGNKFIKLNLTIENTGKEKQSVSTIIQMYLKDKEGTKYTQTLIPDQKQVDGELLAGDKIKGDLVYEVPKAVTGLKFYYNAAWITGKSIVININ